MGIICSQRLLRKLLQSDDGKWLIVVIQVQLHQDIAPKNNKKRSDFYRSLSGFLNCIQGQKVEIRNDN